MPAATPAFFHPAGGSGPGQRLYLYHAPPPGTPTRAAVLYVHPFAEEMNKARRMAALQARLLAAHGFAVLQPDLLGCGDSSGDFADATWENWIADVADAAHWLRQRHPGPLWLWGLRAGALLACEAAARLPGPGALNFLFWQPSVTGRLVVQQFLRIKAAGDMMGGGGKGVVNQLRQELASGRSVDVAGYRLNPALVAGLEAAQLSHPARRAPGRVEWLEVQPQAATSLSPASAQACQAWQAAGWAVRSHVVSGPAFWQTVEIEDAPELIEASLRALATPGMWAGTEGSDLPQVAPTIGSP